MAKKGKAPIRVLMAKVGLDGHERGARVVSFGLRDEGMEVIYTGIRQNVESIVAVAIQEDVDGVGLSSLAGAHELFPEIVQQLKEKGGGEILVIGGGVIPDEDISFLKKSGVSAIFGSGSTVEEIANYIRENVSRRDTA